MKTIEEKIKIILLANCVNKVEASEIKNTDNITTDFNLDSLEKIEVMFDIEDMFDIEISESEGKEIQTVQQAIDYVQSKLNERKK